MMKEKAREVDLVMNTNNVDQGIVNARMIAGMFSDGLIGT